MLNNDSIESCFRFRFLVFPLKKSFSGSETDYIFVLLQNVIDQPEGFSTTKTPWLKDFWSFFFYQIRVAEISIKMKTSKKSSWRLVAHLNNYWAKCIIINYSPWFLANYYLQNWTVFLFAQRVIKNQFKIGLMSPDLPSEVDHCQSFSYQIHH